MTRVEEWVLLARERLLNPPPPGAERPRFRGDLIAEFVLPLDLARPQNAARHKSSWQMAKHRKLIYSAMSVQWLLQRSCTLNLPLWGRPKINVVRFSSRAPDKYSNFGKEAIDVLQPSRVIRLGCKAYHVRGLGIIKNDSPQDIEENQWHELISRGTPGFVYLQVRHDPCGASPLA